MSKHIGRAVTDANVRLHRPSHPPDPKLAKKCARTAKEHLQRRRAIDSLIGVMDRLLDSLTPDQIRQLSCRLESQTDKEDFAAQLAELVKKNLG